MTDMALLKVTEKEVHDAQTLWAEGIVGIGQVYLDHGDYQAQAIAFLEQLYAYDLTQVLFKPTLAQAQQFRLSFNDALSYFVRGVVAEDTGFAIKPWSNVKFGEQYIQLGGEFAIAMGNYYFTEHDQDEVLKVEFTFCYIKDHQNRLRIVAHHSSMPYVN